MKALLHYLLASAVVETSEEKTSALFYEAQKLVEAFFSLWDSLVGPWNAGDLGLIPGSGSSSGEGNGNPLQYSCLENPTDGGAWQAIVHGAAKSRTQLSDFTLFFFSSVLCFV